MIRTTTFRPSESEIAIVEEVEEWLENKGRGAFAGALHFLIQDWIASRLPTMRALRTFKKEGE